jgi:DNA-binding MarR family transcriptional regulator
VNTTRALRDEIFELNERIRTESFALVGPLEFPPDLTMRQLHVLSAVARMEGLTVHQLAETLNIATPTASGLVDRLAEKGLLERVGDEADRRVRHLHLTPTGEETIGQMDTAFDRLLNEMLDSLDSDELTAFRDHFRLVLASIERTRAQRVKQADRTSPSD